MNSDSQKIHQYKQEADLFFSYLENASIPESSLYERVELLYLKGIYQIKLGNIEIGVSMVNKAITILSDLGSLTLAKNMEEYLKLVLNNKK